jgi:hypothetical protein
MVPIMTRRQSHCTNITGIHNPDAQMSHGLVAQFLETAIMTHHDPVNDGTYPYSLATDACLPTMHCYTLLEPCVANDAHAENGVMCASRLTNY